jgi:hypothetical protein
VELKEALINGLAVLESLSEPDRNVILRRLDMSDMCWQASFSRLEQHLNSMMHASLPPPTSDLIEALNASSKDASVHASPVLLKPCPFCRGEGELCFERHDLNDWQVECNGCGAVSCPEGIRYDQESAITDWNERVV